MKKLKKIEKHEKHKNCKIELFKKKRFEKNRPKCF